VNFLNRRFCRLDSNDGKTSLILTERRIRHGKKIKSHPI
jgi:transposase